MIFELDIYNFTIMHWINLLRINRSAIFNAKFKTKSFYQTKELQAWPSVS